MSKSRSKPDVYVVVLDCCRADAFANLATSAADLPEIGRLLKESVYFSRAVATSPWTIPSHASILTGLFPWHHGAYGRRDDDRLSLGPSVPSVGSFLKDRGYRTVLISANGMLGAEAGFGLDRLFDESLIASWWEKYLRFPARKFSSGPKPEGGGHNTFFDRMVSGLRDSIGSRDDALLRYPALMWGLSAMLTKVLDPTAASMLPVSGWIEEAFRQQVNRTDPERPHFFLVNLMDPHEPYFPDQYAYESGVWSTIKLASARQDYVSWFNGKWTPSDNELQTLSRLYLAGVKRSVHRVETLVKVAKERDRWADSLFVVTSDHGQALGEEGLLFHMFRGDEATLRVPLLVKFPRATYGGATCTHRASLVDISPTIESIVDPTSHIPSDGFDLLKLMDKPRSRPPMAYSEGVFSSITRAKLHPRLRSIVDREAIVAYIEDFRFSYYPDSRTFDAFDVIKDPLATQDLWTQLSGSSSVIAQEMKDAALVTSTPLDKGTAPDVTERLRLWGYG